MGQLTDLYLQVWDKPMFQMAQGILLGLMIAAGIALIVKGFTREDLLHEDGTEDVQKEGDDERDV